MCGWRKYSWLFIGLFLVAGNGWAQPAASVLSDGKWVKIGVTRTGVYKLDAAFLNRYGLPTATLDPRTIRLFGNGGAPLPQLNRQNRPLDLTENAILVQGEEDGRFDAGDAVYFFASSPHVKTYDSTARRLTHRLNPYTDTTYYFLNVGLTPGKRITTSSFTAASPAPIRVFDDYVYHEAETESRVQSGREWFGEPFNSAVTSQQVKNFDSPVSDIVPGSSVLITSSVVGKATDTTSFSLTWGTQPIGRQRFNPIYEPDATKSRFYLHGLLNQQTFTVVPSALTNPVQFTYQYNPAGVTNAQGWLNFLALQIQRPLRRYDEQVVFRSLAAADQSAVQYVIQQADAATNVWEVTNPQQVVQMPVAVNEKGEGTVTAPGGSLRSFLLFSFAKAYAPEVARPIANQNLHASTTPQLLIITPPLWRAQAERLADLRRKKEGLQVLVVNTQEVYNEFASGGPDPTAIRDFVRYLYQQAPDKLKYLLLFGDGTYDYKNHQALFSTAQLATKIPVYESRESLNPVTSYCSDDYFGFMDPDEGEWSEVDVDNSALEVGVGRLPVKSVEEATMVVDKLIRYASGAGEMGAWRTGITFVADDGDPDFPNIHQSDADQLARQVATQRPAIGIEKIYVDSYAQVSTPSGQTAPLVNSAITNALNAGRLIVNYTGHGGETGWAAEQIVTFADILNWKNQRLPLFITATCEFGRFDNPAETSGAELTLLNTQGGGIALLTTARPVYSYTNARLNGAFYDAFEQGIKTGSLRLGDLMRLTKNKSIAGVANRNFSLLGDPSMQLAYPTAEVSLTEVNGKPLSDRTDTLRALATVELAGEVTSTGRRLADFTGQAVVSLYDKPDTLATLGTEGGSPMKYTEYRNPLFRGRVSVQNGRFKAQFRMPKDIKYQPGWGKWTAYAVRADSLLDATGSYDSLWIGGSATDLVVDTTPPLIQLYVNDTTFKDGGTVRGPNVTIIGKLVDESGITIARNGIGHQLTMQLNDEPATVVNDYFVGATDDYREGRVEYTWRDKAPGLYTVRLKAWDNYNNSSEASLNFIISGQPALAVQSVEVTPNPFEREATFGVRHNRPGETLEADLMIADLSGRVVTQQTYRCTACSEVWNELSWKGTTAGGAPVNRGLYVYRIILRLPADGSQAIATGKLLYSR